MIDIITKFGLMIIAVFLVVYLVLPDFFPLTNLDEAAATVILIGILGKFGVKI